MATITGVNIYIDGVKHNATPQPLTQATYNISNVKAEGAAFNVQFSYVYDDATESQLTPIQSYSLATTSISFSALSFDSATMVLDSANYQPQGNAQLSQLYTPSILYRNGKTLVVNKKLGVDSILVSELTPNGLRPPHQIGGSKLNGTNYHDQPIFHWDANRLFVIQEDNHGVSPTAYHKASVDNDSLIVNSNSGVLGQTAHSGDIVYPNIYTSNAKKVIIGRYGIDGGSLYEAGYRWSDSMEGIWADSVRLMVKRTGMDRRYQQGMFTGAVSGDIIISSFERNTAGEWVRGNVFRFKIKADGTLDVFTINGTFIRNGIMSVLESDIGQYFEYGGTNAFIPVCDIDADENFYSIQKNGVNYVLSIWKVTQSAPTDITINFPDSPTLVEGLPTQNHAVRFIMPVSLSEIYIFVSVNNGVYGVIRQYKSINEGASWTFVQDIDFGQNVVKFHLTNNYREIGNNNNFLAVAATGATDNTALAVDVFLKKAAFGAIQTETNIYDSLTPISEVVFNANSVLNYSIETGKINNTGTTLNSLIDQSPNAVTELAFGSPVLDNGTTPSYVTFDGVNDYVSLDPALLLANNAYLILEVIDANGVDTYPLNISNNAATDRYILPEIQAALTAKMANRVRRTGMPLETVLGDTETSAGFHIYAWLYRGFGNDVPMWLDGKMQLRNMTGATTINEGSYTIAEGNTNLEIGRLVRTSILYNSFKMKHISIHSVTSEQDVLDRIKYLGIKYGITLLNAYR